MDESIMMIQEKIQKESEILTKLREEIAKVIEQHGGQIEKPYLAVLYLARRKS